MLLQMRIGIVFPLFLAMGLRARRDDAGFHKRMMIRGTAVALPAAIDRMQWLPTTLPASASQRLRGDESSGQRLAQVFA